MRTNNIHRIIILFSFPLRYHKSDISVDVAVSGPGFMGGDTMAGNTTSLLLSIYDMVAPLVSPPMKGSWGLVSVLKILIDPPTVDVAETSCYQRH